MASSVLEKIEDWPVPHAGVAVLNPDGVLGIRGHHLHEFRLASISKVITAMAVLVAVEEGTLDLDEPAGPSGSTVRHLLAHASGLGFEPGSSQLSPPGARRIYSNEGVEVLARHLAEAADMTFDEYLRLAVIDPLGMTATMLRGSPAAGICSNLQDMTRFVAELVSPTLIAPKTAEAMRTVQFPGLPGVLPGVGRFADLAWGLGVEIKGDKTPHWSGSLISPRTFGHFGGSGTYLWVDPEQALDCVMLADREFDEWGMQYWPEFNDLVVSTYGVGATYGQT